MDCRDAPATFPGKVCNICGDGLINVVGEVCDDGNNLNQDGCSMTCQVEPGASCDASQPSICTSPCGNGILETGYGEVCDDGNTNPNDGCYLCVVEFYWECNTASPSVCDGICGDLNLFGGETCEDNNVLSLDGCDSNCRLEPGWF